MAGFRSGLARAPGAMLRGVLRRSTDPFAARTWRRGGRGGDVGRLTPTRRRRGRRGPPRREPSPLAPRRPRRGVPMRSAWNCIRKPLALAPPSARRTPTSSGRTSSTSATWWAIASSAARTRCARVEPRVRPQINPRAFGSHCGEPRPVSAGTKKTPSVEATGRRAPRTRPPSAITPSPSRSHCSAAPPTSTAPSAAN